MKKSLAKFIASCAAGEVSEGAIRGMRKTLNHTATAEEQGAVNQAIERYEPCVSVEQMEKGRAWLLNGSLKKDGTERKNPIISGWRIAVTREAICARLVGLEDAGTYRSDYHPIYRYQTADGRFFDYVPHSWQSGRAPVEDYGGQSIAACTPEQWRNHDYGHGTPRGPVMLRLTPDGRHVETSRGAYMAVVYARQVWRFIKQAREGLNGQAAPATIGDYEIRQIAPDGTVTIGCTTIEYAELARCAALLGEPV